MTMQDMVEYLEAKGFEVTKTYDPKNGSYRFDIRKGVDRVSDVFTYPSDVRVQEKNLRQKEFLDKLLGKYRETFENRVSKYGVVKKHYDIKNVIFNNPATVVLWGDGTKTVVKAENEAFDPEKGLAMAISKKALGNKGNYYNTFEKWLPKDKEANE